MNKQENVERINLPRRFGRALLGEISRPIFPFEVHDAHGGFLEAKRLLKEGYGLMVITNHFSFRDIPEVLLHLLFRSGVSRERRILTPIALHQYNETIQRAADLFGVELAPIITADTIKVMRQAIAGMEDEEARRLARQNLRLVMKEEVGERLASYRQKAEKVFRSEGIVLLSPQSGRKETLGTPIGTPIESLLEVDIPKDRVAVLPVGIGIRGATGYGEEVNGYNPWVRYVINVGFPFPRSDLIDAANFDDTNVDQIAFSLMRRLVPKEYLEKRPKEGVE